MKVDDFNFNPPKKWEQDRRVQPGIEPSKDLDITKNKGKKT